METRPASETIHRWLGGWRVVDLRALAVMRVLLGLCAAYEFLCFLPVFSLVYGGAESALPPSVDPFWGLLSGTHPLWFAGVVWGVGLLAATTFTLGWRTRLSNLVLWLCLFSFHAPHFMVVVNGGSAVLRQSLFLTLLLPLGARFSVDAGRDWRPGSAVSWGVLVLLLHTAFIYFNTAAVKVGPSWSRGTAILDLLQLQGRATPIGQAIAPAVGLQASQILTNMTLIVELCGAVLLLLPFASGWCRRTAAVALLGLHLGIGLLMNVGHFTWIMVAVLIVFASAATPRDPVRAPRFVNALALLLAGFILVNGLRGNPITAATTRALDPVLDVVNPRIRWEREWWMFAPSVTRRESILVVRATRASGAVEDPLTGETPHEGPFLGFPYRMNPAIARELGADTKLAARVADWLLQRGGADPYTALELELFTLNYRRDEPARLTIRSLARAAR